MNSYKQDLKQLKDKIKNMIMWKMKTDTENILKDLFRITDHYLPLSQQGRFSEYDNAKEQLQEQINDLLYIAEEEETVKNRLETIRGDIQKVKELLEDFLEDYGVVSSAQANALSVLFDVYKHTNACMELEPMIFGHNHLSGYYYIAFGEEGMKAEDSIMIVSTISMLNNRLQIAQKELTIMVEAINEN